MDSNSMATNSDIEVQAYIHQILEEFSLFLGESSKLLVEKKSAKKVIKRLQGSGELAENFTATDCYAVSLEENGSKIIFYGFGNDPYSALKEAKDKLLKELGIIYDEVVTNAERVSEIDSYMQGFSTKH